MTNLPADATTPTPYPEVNRVLARLLRDARTVLGDHLVGLYLDGSLTSGDFDDASDIDFVAATDAEADETLFADLQAMHDRIAATGWPWSDQLEGSYVSLAVLRRHDPAHENHPNIERGKGERLKIASHGADWDIHRFVVRERGIPLAGPDPKTLIDPVSPESLRRSSSQYLHWWLATFLDDPEKIADGGYQSYTVLSVCRILYTLEFGTVASKAEAVRWGKETLGARWGPLIDRAWETRRHPPKEAPPAEVAATQDFIRFALERVLPADHFA